MPGPKFKFVGIRFCDSGLRSTHVSDVRSDMRYSAGERLSPAFLSDAVKLLDTASAESSKGA